MHKKLFWQKGYSGITGGYFTKLYLYRAMQTDLGLSTFTRASAQYDASNPTGEMIKYLSGVPVFDLATNTGVLMEPLSTNLFSGRGVPRADALGSELCLNGGFDTDTIWYKAAGATISGGTLNMNGAGSSYQYISTPLGKFYQITYTVSNYSSGTIRPVVRGTTGTNRTANGTYTDIIQGTNTDANIYLSTNGTTFVGSIDNISIKEALDYIGTKAYHDGTVFQNPITSMTLSSADTAPVLSIVPDQAAIDAMTVEKLGRVVNGGKVYDCTTGAGGAAVVTYTGAMAAVPTSFSEYIRVLSGSCVLSDSTGTYTVTPTGTTYLRYKKENFTPTAGATLKLTVAASSQVRFLDPEVESLPFCTSILPSEGATATRAATIVSDPMPLITSGTIHIPIEWTPRSVIAGRIETIWESGVDVNNYTAVFSNGTQVYLEKMVAGVSEKAIVAMVPVKDTTYLVDPYINTDKTLSLKVGGVAADTNTSTTLAPVFGVNIYWGSNGTGASFCNIKTLKIDNRSFF